VDEGKPERLQTSSIDKVGEDNQPASLSHVDEVEAGDHKEPASALPAINDWKTKHDQASGKDYYVSRSRNVSQWDKPVELHI
jgi:hypothetical protein